MSFNERYTGVVCWIGLTLIALSPVVTIATFHIWHWYALLWLLGVVIGISVVWYSVCMAMAVADEYHVYDE